MGALDRFERTSGAFVVMADTSAARSYATPCRTIRCFTRERREAAFLESEPPEWCIELEKWPYHTPEWKQWLSESRAGRNPTLPFAP